jgi:hypothetical protein
MGMAHLDEMRSVIKVEGTAVIPFLQVERSS